jgi:hypothetical protein
VGRVPGDPNDGATGAGGGEPKDGIVGSAIPIRLSLDLKCYIIDLEK